MVSPVYVPQRSDMAVGDMAVTVARKRVVDFTAPWIHFGGC